MALQRWDRRHREHTPHSTWTREIAWAPSGTDPSRAGSSSACPPPAAAHGCTGSSASGPSRLRPATRDPASGSDGAPTTTRWRQRSRSAAARPLRHATVRAGERRIRAARTCRDRADRSRSSPATESPRRTRTTPRRGPSAPFESDPRSAVLVDPDFPAKRSASTLRLNCRARCWPSGSPWRT
jgi:hypothetical protein